MLGTPWKGYYLTAYGIAVKHGFVGTEEEWLASLRGEPGAAAELRYNEEEKAIEWKPEGSEVWAAIVPLSELQGELVAATLEEAEKAAKSAETAKTDAMAAASAAKKDAEAAGAAEKNILQNILQYGSIINNAYVLGDVLYIATNNGKVFAAGNVRGPKADAPVRGVDYWTKEDKEEVINAASPVRGTHYWTKNDKTEIMREIDTNHAHYGVPATGVLLEEKTYEHTINAKWWEIRADDFIEYVDLIKNPELGGFPYFKVVWNGNEYQVKNYDDVNLSFIDTETNAHVGITIADEDMSDYVLRVSLYNEEGVTAENVAFTLTPATGVYESNIKQLDPIFIPDYVSKTYVDKGRTHGVKPIYGEKTVFDLSDADKITANEYWASTAERVAFEAGKQYAVNWHGKIYICTAEETYYEDVGVYEYSICNPECGYPGKEGYFCFIWEPGAGTFNVSYWGYTESCEIMPYSEEVEQLDTKYIPDYISKTEVEETVGDINTALDRIIAMQNELIGGDAE